MQFSTYNLSINDFSSSVEDKKARSKSFYSKCNLVNVTSNLIDEIKNIAIKENRNSRVLLHSTNQDLVHEMIIFQHFKKLDGTNNIMYRVDPGHYHMDIPLTTQTIHFETTTGPFLGDTDNIVPHWFSNLNDKERIEFHDRLLNTYK